MTRNKGFETDREPLRKNDVLGLNLDKVHGPVRFLNPTQAHFSPIHTEKSTNYAASEESRRDAPSGPLAASNIEFKWTSRDNRKGRHALVVQPIDGDEARVRTPPQSNNASEVLRNILRMLFYYPVWDISYIIAILFTFGSFVWMANAFHILLPLTTSDEISQREVLFTAGIAPFVATSTFLLACILLVIEAFNENREGCFGWATERIFDIHDHQDDPEPDSFIRIVPRKDECTHHHQNVLHLVGKPSRQARQKMLKKSVTSATAYPDVGDRRMWVWFPSWHEMRTHYIHEFGFLACCVQLFGILAYWISSVVVLPRIDRALGDASQLDVVYWS